MMLVSGTSSGLGRYLAARFAAMPFRRALPLEEYRRYAFDVIIHCAFRSQRIVGSTDLYDYFDDNTLLTIRLTSLRCRTFVYLSTVDVYPHNGKPHREDEEIGLAAQASAYGTTKLLSEAIVHRQCRKYLILRPTAMVGDHIRPNLLTRLILERDFATHLSSDSSFNHISHSDVGDFIDAALGQDLSGTFNLASAANVSLAEIAAELAIKPKFGCQRYDIGYFDNAAAAAFVAGLRRGSLEKVVKFARQLRVGWVPSDPLPSLSAHSDRNGAPQTVTHVAEETLFHADGRANPAQKIDILSCNVPLSFVAALRKRNPEIIVHRAVDAAALAPKIRNRIIAALVWGVTPCNLGLLPKLAMVHAVGAGVDRLLADGVVPPQVPIVRAVSERQAVGMSEYVLLHVLRHHRDLGAIFDRYRKREWGASLANRTRMTIVGVMGLGEIGRRVCHVLVAAGFQVRGLSRTRKALTGIECFDQNSFDSFLEGCHHLVCLLPLTPATEGILNSRTFSRLAAGAFLINAGRGRHLVEADLIPALDSGRIGGATLDVLVDEPPSTGHAFWSDPRILLTGHSAVSSAVSPEDIVPLISDNLDRLAGALPLRHLVHRSKGY